MPRVERMTEMKWMQVFSRSGAEEDLVSSWFRDEMEQRKEERRGIP